MSVIPYLVRTLSDKIVTVIAVVLFLSWLIADAVRNYRRKKKEKKSNNERYCENISCIVP